MFVVPTQYTLNSPVALCRMVEQIRFVSLWREALSSPSFILLTAELVSLWGRQLSRVTGVRTVSHFSCVQGAGAVRVYSVLFARLGTEQDRMLFVPIS
jgi:hypothetical protein